VIETVTLYATVIFVVIFREFSFDSSEQHVKCFCDVTCFCNQTPFVTLLYSLQSGYFGELDKLHRCT